MKSVLILGGDGYLGWPLSLKIARRFPRAQVVIADNLTRRKLVSKVGGQSLTPIVSPEARIQAYQRITGGNNIEFVHQDVSGPGLAELVARVEPDVVYHLAHQASAPYSMKGVDEAVFTLINNEVSNMRLLWALYAHVPRAHLIKLGTFGEYAKFGTDIAEGYFFPEYNGKKANAPAPYPRAADDIYHTSKINDSNYISMACRKWGLRVTDIMQSTVFGVEIEESRGHPELYTRLDYDAVFGTVLNRFLTQAVAGYPMTIYGSGNQRTGLMAIEDALNSMVDLAERTPARGEHRVINHVTERDHCINELAEMVADIARARSIEAGIRRGAYDPRQESDLSKADYRIETHYVNANLKATPLDKVIHQTFDIANQFADRINVEAFPPRVNW